MGCQESSRALTLDPERERVSQAEPQRELVQGPKTPGLAGQWPAELCAQYGLRLVEVN